MTEFGHRYGEWALIAGGSEGLGYAFAAEAAERGLGLILVARRSGPLREAASQLRAAHAVRVHTVAADLAEPQTYDELLPTATAGMQIGLLVANAAHAPVGPFLGLNGPEIHRTLRVNCDAPVRLARTYLPFMVERRRGGFVVVSSAAGLQGSPDLTLYAATKAFGRIFAEGLWAELRQARVDVIACIAGAVRTPGWEASGMRTAPGILPSRTVAAQTYDRLGRRPIVVPGRITWTATRAMRRLPRRSAVALMARANRRLNRRTDL